MSTLGRGCRAIVVALWLTPAAALAAGADQPPDAVIQSVAAMHADGSFQFTLPQPKPPAPPPQWLLDFFKWLAGFFRWLGLDAGLVLNGLFWIVVALLVLIVLYFTVPAVRDAVDAVIARGLWRRNNAPDTEDAPWQPDADSARNLLQEADALAAAGQFGEAAHLLLARSVEDIAQRRPGLIRPALTARAIAIMRELPAPARAAFGSIAVIVERAVWARRAVDRDGWQTARAAYEEFAFGGHWRIQNAQVQA